jgi:hypothetical protein
MPLEILDVPLVLLGLFDGREGTQVTPLAGCGVFLAGIQAKLATLQFSYHVRSTPM